jgi:hypothetical protein
MEDDFKKNIRKMEDDLKHNFKKSTLTLFRPGFENPYSGQVGVENTPAIIIFFPPLKLFFLPTYFIGLN